MTSSSSSLTSSDVELGFGERALAAAGAAVLSAIIVNPLDVAKTRLQAQAAGVPYHPSNDRVGRHMTSNSEKMMFSDLRCPPSCNRGGTYTTEPSCSPDCFRYKGTLDVLYKVTRQEGFSRLWRGTNASLALAIPTVGIYLPCYDIFRNWMEEFTSQHSPMLTPYAPLVAGSVARSLACIACSPIELARTRMQAFKEFQGGAKPPGMRKTLLGVLSPFRSTKYLENLIVAWTAMMQIRRRLFEIIGDEGSAVSVLSANFSAGVVAGCLAAAATCPLDVVKTRRQIDKDPQRALHMTTRKTLVDVWRNEGAKGLFIGVGPRVGRAGPSVGIVVSFYEVVKFVLHQRPSPDTMQP